MLNEQMSQFGSRGVHLLEKIGLYLVTLATVVAFGQELAVMFAARTVTLGDLLLMFIYIEVFSMVGQYLSSGKLPVRYPLYIGMVALARFLVLDIKHMSSTQMLAVAAAILVLAIAVLVVRYGHVKYSYSEKTAVVENNPS